MVHRVFLSDFFLIWELLFVYCNGSENLRFFLFFMGGSAMTNSFFAAARNVIYIFVGLVIAFVGASEVSAQTGGSFLDFGAEFGDGFVLEDPGLTDDGRLFYTSNQEIDGQNIARLIEVAADRQSFTYQELIGEGETFAGRIAADGSWISGFSNTSISDGREAFAWNSNDTSNGFALGFGGAFNRLSWGRGAFSNGVVGSFGGLANGFSWSPDGGFDVLADGGDLARANDASLNGSIAVGSSADYGSISGAVVWDASGISPLDDPHGSQSIANAIAPNATFIGGQIDFFDSDTFESGFLPAIWERDSLGEYNLSFLEKVDPDTGNLSRIFGEIQDVTDSGWAVGSFINELGEREGLIWHPSFNGIDSEYLGAQSFNDWLEDEANLILPSELTSVVGISENLSTGELNFASGGSAFSITVSVPEPSSIIILSPLFAVLMLRRRRS